MFFQLSLSSTPTAAETAGDSVLPELGGAGTLTVPAQERPARDQVARLLATRARESRDSLRCRVTPAHEAAVTFTARTAPADQEDPGLQ
jgi:hypothetical protein